MILLPAINVDKHQVLGPTGQTADGHQRICLMDCMIGLQQDYGLKQLQQLRPSPDRIFVYVDLTLGQKHNLQNNLELRMKLCTAFISLLRFFC